MGVRARIGVPPHVSRARPGDRASHCFVGTIVFVWMAQQWQFGRHCAPLGQQAGGGRASASTIVHSPCEE